VSYCFNIVAATVTPRMSHGLQHYHMPCGFGPYLPAKMRSGAATCPVAPDLASLLRRDLALPHVLWLWALLPRQGGLWYCHVSHDLLWAAGLEHKEMASRPSYAARLTRSQGVLACLQGSCA
jgi:hypothetical protein